MTKFRIVEVISNSGHSDRKGYWIVEQKKWFGWTEIYHNEGPNSKSVVHESYKDAELYLLEKYTGHGECRVFGNVYVYKPYTYYMG
jgi:hypothetical protein